MTVINVGEQCCCRDCDMVPDFTATQGSGCTFNFTDTSTPTIPASPANWWRWDFGDGATSTAQNPSHTFSIGACSGWWVTLEVSCDGGASKRSVRKWVYCQPCTQVPTLISLTISPIGPVGNGCRYAAIARVRMVGSRTVASAQITQDGVPLCGVQPLIMQVATNPNIYDIVCYGVTTARPALVNFGVHVIDSCGCELTAPQLATVNCVFGDCVPNCSGQLPEELLVSFSGIANSQLWQAFYGASCGCQASYGGPFVLYRTSLCSWEASYWVNNQAHPNCLDFVTILARLGDIDATRGWNVQLRIVDSPYTVRVSQGATWAMATNGVCAGAFTSPAPYTQSISSGYFPAACELGAASCSLTV